MANFNALKNKKRDMKKLKDQADSITGGSFKKDERIWKPQRDEQGNAYCIVRFLDLSPIDIDIKDKIAKTEGEDAAEEKVLPFVLKYGHSFKGPGGWYIEDSRTTLGNDESDPLAELNKAEWDDNDEEAKKKVSARSRKKKYYSNVLVIKDQNKPENEGKVFLFEYGQKIFDKLKEPMKPQFPGDPEFDPFNFYEGANFIIKVFSEKKGKNLFPNYDKSEFAAQTQLFDGDDEKIEALWNKTYSLQDLISPDKFKSYAELKKRLDMVMKRDSAVNDSIADDADDSVPDKEEKTSNEQESGDNTPTPEPSKSDSYETDVDDDDMDFFENLGK